MAQLTVTSPVPRLVFQRNPANSATFVVTGLAPVGATTVEARVVPLVTGQGSATNWTALSLVAGNSTAYRGRLTATAGWYRLDVRASAGATVLAQTSVNRVGVGEVFVLAGQSNMAGGFEREPGAADDRVSCVDIKLENLDEQLLPFTFSHVSYGTSIGPSQPPHIWGMLGDKLTQRLNVPVLFLGAAQVGSSSDQWRQSAAGTSDPAVKLLPYRRMGAVLLDYVARTGARAVLWHQGEADIGSGQQTYFDNLQYVIQKSRQQTSAERLPWVVSRVSYTQGQTNPNVIAAQNQLIAQLPAVFAGPSTDDLIGPDNRRPDNVHIGGLGLARFADRWNQALTDQFFQNAVPFTPTDEATLLTTGYAVPPTRRPGETVLAASLRSDAHEADNQYKLQLVRAADNSVVTESAAGTANPLPLTLPANLSDGLYRLRTISTHPVVIGTLGEPFTVSASAPPVQLPTPVAPVATGGTGDTAILRIGYRYESGSHGFYATINATVPVEMRLESVDGTPFGDTDWHSVPPASQAPDFTEFADFNYIRNYPPTAFGVGGVSPGRYRFWVRRAGDTGTGLWAEGTLQDGRVILYAGMEPVYNVPTPPNEPTTADLSLTLRIASRTALIGQAVACTLSVANAGPLATSGVMLQSRLPDGLEFVDGATSGISAVNNVVTINAGSVAAGAAGSFAFRVKATRSGTFATSAQVTASALPDPDSQPNSGTGDGQDDAATADLRTADGTGVLSTSPNPNQVPLPAVQLNQPVPDATKADLSLLLSASRLSVPTNDTVSLTLRISNRGGAAVSTADVQALLPAGWQLVSTGGLSVNGQTVTATVGTVPVGGSATVTLVVRVSGPGTIRAQISSSPLADPDSTPGNGYANGEDDSAAMSVRVR